MAFGWEDYLILAKDISDDENDEAALRSAVSRTYYAVFNLVKDILDQKEATISENTDSIHRSVWNACNQRGRSWAKVYKNANNLRKRRVSADYVLKPQNPNGKSKDWYEEAQQSIHEAEEVLYWVGRLTAGEQAREN
jgi:uncharacterized protein (UPF0332 family)